MATVLFTDPQTGEAPGVTQGRNLRSRCRCSTCPAIHINSRSWLRSSSTHEPSDPPHRVVQSHNSVKIRLDPFGQQTYERTIHSLHDFNVQFVGKRKKIKNTRGGRTIRQGGRRLEFGRKLAPTTGGTGTVQLFKPRGD